ncbi:MAG: hypothetical protein AAFV53_19870 [Myxococcota bacterium]
MTRAHRITGVPGTNGLLCEEWFPCVRADIYASEALGHESTDEAVDAAQQAFDQALASHGLIADPPNGIDIRSPDVLSAIRALTKNMEQHGRVTVGGMYAHLLIAPPQQQFLDAVRKIVPLSLRAIGERVGVSHQALSAGRFSVEQAVEAWNNQADDNERIKFIPARVEPER